MNIEMDEAAKQTIEVGTQGSMRYQLLNEPGVCYMGGNQFITKTVTKLREEINKITIKEH